MLTTRLKEIMKLLKLNKRRLKTVPLKRHLVLVLEINVGSDPNPGSVKCQNQRVITQNQRNPVNDDPGPVIASRTENVLGPGQGKRNRVNDGPDLVNVEAKTGNVPDPETTENPDQDLGKEIENNVQDLDPGTEAENVRDQNQGKDQTGNVPDQNQGKRNDPDQETENVRDPDLETENGLDHVIGDVDQGLNQKNVVINVIENVPIAQDQKIENRNSHHLGQRNAVDVMILLLLILLHHLQVQTENKSWQLLRVSYHSDPQLLFL